jgi:hypothetical protein
VQVVHRQQKWPPRGDVRRQPVEPVQRRQRRVRGRRSCELGGVEDGRGERRRVGEQLGSLLRGQPGKKRLEQLSHDPVGERALELGAARAQDLHPRLPGSRLPLHDQGRLADSRRSLDHQQPLAADGRPDRGVDRRQLRVALEQVMLRRERLPWQLRTAVLLRVPHR